jgi:hypothetical protein
MKIVNRFLLLLLFPILLISCDKINSILEGDKTPDPNTIADNPVPVPTATVGTSVTTSVKVGNTSYPISESIKVTKNENGVTTYKVTADLTKSTDLQKINNYIPSSYKEVSTGKINTEIKYKSTPEGIQDYFNLDGKAHTVAKYDAKVGDTYKMSKSNGTVITRTVTAVSTTDDFPYQGMYIKTITTEQDSRIPGVKKIVYQSNHKYGLVYVEVQMEDGTKASTYLNPSNY